MSKENPYLFKENLQNVLYLDNSFIFFLEKLFMILVIEGIFLHYLTK